VDEGWLLKSPFTKSGVKEFDSHAAETPDPIQTRELTDEEALRVMRRSTLLKGVTPYHVHCGNGYWSQKVRLWITFVGKTLTLVRIITLTAYKGKGRTGQAKALAGAA